MYRFTMMNHLCADLQTIPDITRPPDRIRQDVTRSPGGDSSLFLNNCIECHSGMDPMAQAFAYYNYSYNVATDPTGAAGTIVYTAGQVQPKYFINNTNFPQGFITPDDSWANRMRGGVEFAAGMGRDEERHGHAATAPRVWGRNSKAARPSPAARSRGCSSMCACARRATRRTRRRSAP